MARAGFEKQLQAIALQHSPSEVLSAAVSASSGLIEDGGSFAALPEDGGYRMSIAEDARDPRFTQISVRPGVGLGGYVLLLRAPAVVDDYARDSRITRDFVEIVHGSEGLLGVACAPVIVRDKVEGLLYLGDRRPGRIDDRVMERLEAAASFASVGIEHAHERRRQLQLSRLRDRERLATQLHDSVAQMLFGIGVSAQQSLLTGDPARLEAAMREIEATAADARRELRETLERLADTDEGVAFEARLEGEVRLFSSQSGCKARIARSGVTRPLPDLVEDLVVDATLEGMRNAVKHEGATFVLAFLEYEPGCVKLAVQREVVDGRLVPSAACGTGRGLAALEARARRLGGTLALIDGEGGAKVLRLQVPASPVG